MPHTLGISMNATNLPHHDSKNASWNNPRIILLMDMPGKSSGAIVPVSDYIPKTSFLETCEISSLILQHKIQLQLRARPSEVSALLRS
jgi:hypothetical protein